MTRIQEKPPAGVERGGRSCEGGQTARKAVCPPILLYPVFCVRGHSPVSFSSSHTSASPREKSVENPVDNLWKGRGKTTAATARRAGRFTHRFPHPPPPDFPGRSTARSPLFSSTPPPSTPCAQVRPRAAQPPYALPPPPGCGLWTKVRSAVDRTGITSRPNFSPGKYPPFPLPIISNIGIFFFFYYSLYKKNMLI